MMMMKRLIRLLALLFVPAIVQATTTVTGTMQNLGTGATTPNAFMRFWLRGCGGNQPRVSGTSLIAPSQGGVFYFDLAANSSGAVSGTLYSTRDSTGLLGGDINCGGSTTAVWYGMQAWFNGKAGPEVPVHAKSGTTLDISQVAPITTNPVVSSPTGDTTYARLDGANQPFQANVTPTGSGTLSLGSTGNRWNVNASAINASGAGTYSGNNTFSGANTFSSTVTLTGTATCNQFQKIRCVDTANSAGWGGSDPGAWINSASATCPSYTGPQVTPGVGPVAAPGGCTILLAQGAYTVSTPIQFVSGMELIGAGPEKTTLKAANSLNHSVVLIGVNAAETGQTAGTIYWTRVAFLSIDGNAQNQSSAVYDIHMGKVNTTYLDHLEIKNATSHSVAVDNGSLSSPASAGGGVGGFFIHYNNLIAAQTSFRNDSAGTAPAGIYCWGCADSWIDHNAIDDFNQTNGSSYGVYFRDSGDVHLTNNLISFGQVAGVRVETSGSGQQYVRDNFIDVTDMGVQFIGIGDAEIAGNFIRLGSSGTNSAIAAIRVQTASFRVLIDRNYGPVSLTNANGLQIDSGATAAAVQVGLNSFTVTGGGAEFVDNSFKSIGPKIPSLTFYETGTPNNGAGVSGQDWCYGDSTNHVLKCSINNGTYFNMTQSLAAGTATMTTAAIASGACGTTVTVGATGVATTDAITWSYNAAPAANPAQLVVSVWPTANNVNFQYCNPTANSITPTAATLNFRVTR
ncbi:MAG: hypothetical protein JO356_01045 [Acidobacteria bacterium]|nr:hypothetical protein [Acidobacteriota bacterium]